MHNGSLDGGQAGQGKAYAFPSPLPPWHRSSGVTQHTALPCETTTTLFPARTGPTAGGCCRRGFEANESFTAHRSTSDTTVNVRNAVNEACFWQFMQTLHTASQAPHCNNKLETNALHAPVIMHCAPSAATYTSDALLTFGSWGGWGWGVAIKDE